MRSLVTFIGLTAVAGAADMLHVLGIDHERLTFRSQGRDSRLTDVAGPLVKDILA